MSLCVGGGACGELRPAPPLALGSYPPVQRRRAHARVIERSTTRAWAVRGSAISESGPTRMHAMSVLTTLLEMMRGEQMERQDDGDSTPEILHKLAWENLYI